MSKRRFKAVGAVVCAASLSMGLGMMATAGAATPRTTSKVVATPKMLEASALSSVEAAMKTASHIKSKSARLVAERTALQHFQSQIKVATAQVKPTAAALAEARSPQVLRAEKAVTRPGSVLTGGRAGTGTHANVASGFDQSSNWSGYEDENETYNYVFGEWTVPAANCGHWYNFNFSQSSTWVGIDGSASSTVEQLGTATGCVAGASTYYAWTEMYPQLEDPIFEGISPGDQMMAFVFSYDNATQYELYIVDLSQGWSDLRFASTSSPLANSSAEWVTERPDCGPPCYNLTNFGTTTFTDSYAIGNNTFGSISSFPNNAIDMNNDGNWCAEVGGLVNGGSQFTDWFEHS